MNSTKRRHLKARRKDRNKRKNTFLRKCIAEGLTIQQAKYQWVLCKLGKMLIEPVKEMLQRDGLVRRIFSFKPTLRQRTEAKRKALEEKGVTL